MARRSRALAALATLAVVTVGVPALLVVVAGWPLPRQRPSWERIRIALQQGDIPAEVVVKTIAVLVWIAWAQLMWALAWEVIVNLRATERGTSARPTPLAPRMMSSAVTRLVALAFSIGATTLSTASTVLATATPPVTIAAPLGPVATLNGSDATVDRAESVPAGVRWCVGPGDSLWSIAEASLGDGSRVTELLELNRSIRSPRELQPGQVLNLPADAQVPADRFPQPEVAAPAESPATLYAPAEEIEVVPGDNLWDLADARLERVAGTPPTGPEVLDYVNAIVAANPAEIDNPNLIYPRQRFVLPEIGTPPPAPPAEVVDVPDPLPVDTVPTTVDTGPTVAPQTVEPPAVAEPAPPVPTATPVATTLPPPIEQAAPTADASVGAGVWLGETSSSRTPVVVGVSGATALATGLLLAYRRLRGRQTAAGASAARQRRVPPQVAATERALVAAADVSLVEWAAAELSELMSNPAVATDVQGAPLVVELSEEHGIEILWSEANLSAPPPWKPTADGWTWHLPYDPGRQVAPDPSVAQLPGLVTVGHREGRQVLLDVEAFGSISLAGDLRRAEDLARAIAMELGTGEALSNAFVSTVAMELPAVEHLGRVSQCDLTSAAKHVSGVVRDFGSVLADGTLPDTFRLRAIDGAMGRELIVLVAGAGVPADYLVDALEALTPHRGAAAVVVGEHPTARATIVIDECGHAVLRPLRLEFEVAGLPSDSARAVETAIQDAAESLVPSAVAEGSLSAEPFTLFDEPDPSTNGDGLVEDDWQPPSPALLVRVLGPPCVVSVEGLSATGVSLVAFLACHGHKATEDQLINAVWNGKAVNKTTVWNHITKIRSALGSHMPPRKPGDAVRLGDDVMTDLAILKLCAAHAREAASGRAIELLTHGLELIEGAPFDLPGYDWASEHQYHAEACAGIEGAALQLVGLALQAGQLDIARRAIEQGLRAVPANEPLYRERMKLEAHAGNHTAVRQAFAELQHQLDELGGGIDDFEPSPETIALAKRLTNA
jgi:DNA-binding SARP family transcriptional activator